MPRLIKKKKKKSTDRPDESIYGSLQLPLPGQLLSSEERRHYRTPDPSQEPRCRPDLAAPRVDPCRRSRIQPHATAGGGVTPPAPPELVGAAPPWHHWRGRASYTMSPLEGPRPYTSAGRWCCARALDLPAPAVVGNKGGR